MLSKYDNAYYKCILIVFNSGNLLDKLYNSYIFILY